MKYIDCPYQWCSKTVTLLPAPRYPGTHREDTELIKAHELGHPMLTGACPASNMHYPLDEHAEANLREQEENDRIRLPKMIVDSVPEKPSKYLLPWDERLKPPSSQSLRNKGRAGREPEPNSEDWVLGGRDDEDSGKTAGPEDFTRPPMGVIGKPVMGRSMASLDETVGSVNASAMKSGEALTVVQECENELALASAALEESRNLIVGAMQQVRSETLANEALMLEQAQNRVSSMVAELERVKGEIIHAHELGEQFIGNVLS